jgi:D-serine deaminase-like pyridoxal phosphate-dependent protein
MTTHDPHRPALLIDKQVLDRNLSNMANYCHDHNLRLQPHTKTHKLPEIARLQLRHGASGITVAKLARRRS